MVTSALQLIKGTVSACYFEKISKIYFAFLAKQLAAPEIQSALQESISDSYARLAISLLMIDQGLGGVRPYLTVHDELQSKGYSEVSLDILYQIQKKSPWHPLVIGRLLNRLHSSKNFPEIISLLDYLPAKQREGILNVNGVRNVIIDISKFLLCDTLLLKFGVFTEEIKWISEQKAGVAHYSLQDISSLIDDEKYDIAQKSISYLYSSGIRTPEFFNLASSPMKNELDINSRVLFFRIEAERHCTDAKISELAAKSYLNIGEIERAFHVLRRAIMRRCYNEQIIYLLTRVMPLLGKPMGDLLLMGFFRMPDYARVSSFIEESSFNLSINSGKLVESEFLANGLYNRNNEFLRKPVSFPMITHPRSQDRVAICLSGQIRGLEENYKNILSVKDSIKNCDIFVDTWSKGRLTFPRFSRVQRYLGDSLWALLPDIAKMPDGFRRLFPEVTSIISKPLELDVTEAYLRTYFPDAVVNIECESAFEEKIEECAGLRHRGNFNQAKMFYKIHAANSLIKKSTHCDNYDVVIRWRPDLDISIDDLHSYIDDVSRDRNLIYTSYVSAVGYGDQFAIGSREAMDLYSSLWEKITDTGRLAYSNLFDEDATYFAAEALLANHLLLNGLNIKVAKPKRSYFTTSLAINLIDIEDALMRDISQNGLHEEMKAFMSHFNACRANNVRFK